MYECLCAQCYLAQSRLAGIRGNELSGAMQSQFRSALTLQYGKGVLKRNGLCNQLGNLVI